MCADFFREKVSGPKKRYQENGYNLDLTYITPRIIAMAYPAQGLQKLYRNSADEVAKFLYQKHGSNYMVINVSGRQLQSTKLFNVQSFYWEDHKTPEFHKLFQICEVMMGHLLKSPDKVCVVHCNHGKGRTGTLICCFLLFVGYFKTASDVLKFYAKRRYEKDGYGVTQPCQIRYIEYFQKLLNSSRKYPDVVYISKIKITGHNHLKEPYFKLFKVSDTITHPQKRMVLVEIFTTKGLEAPVCEFLNENQQWIKLKERKFFVGDVILEIKHSPFMGKHLASSYMFNTAFIQNQRDIIYVNIDDLSPLSSTKNGNFQSNFRFEISFKRICSCESNQHFESRCKKCQEYLKSQKDKWDRIGGICEKRPQTGGEKLVNGTNNEEFNKSRNTC